MDERKIVETVKQFADALPTFPDGRIDYTHSDVAPIITVFVKYKGKILLLKRSDKVHWYKRRWNVVAGYLDEVKPAREKVFEELHEELGITEKNVGVVFFGESYTFTDEAVKKTWIVHPVLVDLEEKPVITLDWEHTEYQWVMPSEMQQFDALPDLEMGLKSVQGG